MLIKHDLGSLASPCEIGRDDTATCCSATWVPPRRSAVKLMEDWLVTPTFFVFSDDPTWCKSNLSFQSATEYFGTSNEDDPTIISVS